MLKVGLWIFLLCLVVFRSSCYATSCKMKCSVGDSNLTGGEGLTKVRKFLDFGREDLGHAWRHWYRERFWSWKRRPTKCQIWEMFCVENSRRIKTSSGIKPKQSEDLYQLESWRTRNFPATGFCVARHFTSHFKALSTQRLRTSYSISRSYACGAITPSDKQNYDHQSRQFA